MLPNFQTHLLTRIRLINIYEQLTAEKKSFFAFLIHFRRLFFIAMNLINFW